MASVRAAIRTAVFSSIFAGGCGSPPTVDSFVVGTPSPIESEPPATLDVEIAGCEGGERASATCVVKTPGVLSIWVAGATAPQLVLDGTPRASESSEAIDGGWRSALKVPAGTKLLEVTREGAVSWSLKLSAPPPTPTLDRLVEALPDQNDPKRAPALRAAIAEIDRVVPTMELYERVEMLRIAAILAWDSGVDPVTYGRRALAAALELDDATVIVNCADILVHMLGENATEAGVVIDLESLYAANALDAASRARERYAVGVQAVRLEDTSEGFAALEQSESLARRVGIRSLEVAALSYRTAYLGIYGLHAQRASASERLLGLVGRPGPFACDDVDALANLTSATPFLPRDGKAADSDEALLRRALAMLEGEDAACSVGDNADLQLKHVNARISYVDTAIARQDWDEVAARLQWFDNRTIPVAARAAIAVARVELALARSDFARARRVIAEVPAKSVDDLMLDWRIAIARGRLERASGRNEAALAAFLSAEAVLDGMVGNVDADQGREGIGVGLYAGAAGAIDLLALAGRTTDAATVARHSRARTLRPTGQAARIADLEPQERRGWTEAIGRYRSLRDRLASDLTSAWSLPSDERAKMQQNHVELRAQMLAQHNRAFEILASTGASTEVSTLPTEGELWMIFHPAAEGWFGITATTEATRVVPLGELPRIDDMPALATALLGPFDEEIDQARTIKFLGMGSLLDLPFHELPLGAGALVDRAPVVWCLDAGTRARQAPSQRALVVADPATTSEGVGELLRSRAEGDGVAAALRGAGITVDELYGDDATATAVLERLEHVEWFHYAGHGPSRRATGWDSAMPLAGEAELGVRDVLAAAVPRIVVLSGCSTAAVSPGTANGGVSLATAFILAGSEFVIGSTRDVLDDDAADMAETLYRTLGPQSVAERFQAAVVDGRARGRDWTRDLRLWVP